MKPQLAEDCAAAIVDHCVASPEDPSCSPTTICAECSADDEGCPCGVQSCVDVAALDMCARSSCAAYNGALIAAFAGNGNFYAQEWEWVRKTTPGAVWGDGTTPYPAWDDAAFDGARDGCDDAVAELVYNCTVETANYCNDGENWWDGTCRNRVSTCGDGLLTYGESCDDGTPDYEPRDGCSYCGYDPTYFYCPTPGEPCEPCYRENVWDVIWSSNRDTCPFCLARADTNATSPCYQDACADVTDYDGARACDDAVAAWCALVEEAGGSDPGCADYELLQYEYTVPRVANNCSYSTEALALDGDSLVGVEVLVVVCEFVDPHGVIEDTTPLIEAMHPYHHMDASSISALTDPVKTQLDETYVARGTLKRLSEVTLTETYTKSDVTIFSGSEAPGGELWRGDALARLQLADWESCWGGLELVTLPPCGDEPTKMAMSMLARRLKWGAVHETGSGDTSQWSPYLGVDVDKAEAWASQCEVTEGTYVGGAIISWSYADGDEIRVETTSIGDDDGYVEVAEALTTGAARVTFSENKMYQAGCESTDCAYLIESCSSNEARDELVDLFGRRLRILRAEAALAVDLFAVDAHEHLALLLDLLGGGLHGEPVGLEGRDAREDRLAEPGGLGLEGSRVAVLDLDLDRRGATEERPHGTTERGGRRQRRAQGSPTLRPARKRQASGVHLKCRGLAFLLPQSSRAPPRRDDRRSSSRPWIDASDSSGAASSRAAPSQTTRRRGSASMPSRWRRPTWTPRARSTRSSA